MSTPTLEQFREQVTEATRAPLLARIEELKQALNAESALRAETVQRAAHFLQRLDKAKSLGKAAREELAQAKARIEELEKDAARWNMLPAVAEDHQIDLMKIYRDIDAAIDAAMAKEAP